MGLYQFSGPTNDPPREPAADILRRTKKPRPAIRLPGLLLEIPFQNPRKQDLWVSRPDRAFWPT
jgi:hypothetical protein